MIGTLTLPDWVTCADCRHCRRCVAIFGQEATDKECQWIPSRFSAADPQGLLARAQAQAPAPTAPTVLTPDMMGQLEDLDR